MDVMATSKNSTRIRAVSPWGDWFSLRSIRVHSLSPAPANNRNADVYNGSINWQLQIGGFRTGLTWIYPFNSFWPVLAGVIDLHQTNPVQIYCHPDIWVPTNYNLLTVGLIYTNQISPTEHSAYKTFLLTKSRNHLSNSHLIGHNKKLSFTLILLLFYCLQSIQLCQAT